MSSSGGGEAPGSHVHGGINLIFFKFYKELPYEITSGSQSTTNSVCSPKDSSLHSPRKCSSAESSFGEQPMGDSKHWSLSQQKLHYKSSKQSYLLECLCYYESLLSQHQRERSNANSDESREEDSSTASSGTSNLRNSSRTHSQGKSSTLEPVIPQWSLDLSSLWHGDKRVLFMLQLGNAYLEYGQLGEANYWFMATKTLCHQNISTQPFDPYLEYLFIETQYGLACTLYKSFHFSESIQYLEAAYQRVTHLISTFAHPHMKLINENDLTYNIIMLYIKIIIQASLHQSKYDIYQFNSILVNQTKNDNSHHLTLRLLQKAMNLFILLAQKDQSLSNVTTQKDPVTNRSTSSSVDGKDSEKKLLYISNYYHRKSIIHLFFLTAEHLNALDFDLLAKDFLDKIQTLLHNTLHAGHSLCTSAHSLLQQLEKQLQKNSTQRLKIMSPIKQQSKLSILSQFTEEDSDDEDDWSYEDDTEEEEENLSSRLRNRLGGNQQSMNSLGSSRTQNSNTPLKSKKNERLQKDILNDSIFPDRFRFFKSRNLDDAQKHQKPYPSVLFSLRLPNGKTKFENVDNHCEWLADTTNRHGLNPENHSANENIIVNNFLDDLKYIDEFSIPWAIKFYETCDKLFYLGTSQSTQHCNDILARFFTVLPEAKMTENIDKDDLKNYVALFNIGIELLRIAALTTFSKNRESFNDMKNNLQQFYPKYMDYVTLIYIEALCHNLGANSSEDDFIISTLLQLYEKYHTMVVITPSGKSEKDESNPNNRSTENGRENSRKTPVINSLYHIRQGYELASQSLLILHHYLCHLSPITRSPIHQTSPSIDFSQHAENNMMDIHHRVHILESLYKKIHFLSPLKARIAVTIGNYYRVTKRNMKLSEKAFFESLYIFDSISSSSILPKRPPILSLFALSAMSEYAETLLERNKYSIASICYDSLVLSHRILYGEHNYKLMNKLAVLCAKNNDWNRSAQFILILLQKAQNDRDIPKVVFLSEKLSREYMERGDFRNAEYYITQCVEFLEENDRSSYRGRRDAFRSPSKTDLELKLQLKLAHLFLQGYYFERGIDLLAKLMDQKLSPIQKCQVLLELSEAYLKKRWLKESEIVLEKLVKHLKAHHILLGNSDVFNHVSMLQIAARLYYRKGQYALSLFCVNTALQQCDPSQLPRFANLFRIKGKIFHAISKSNSNISFPTSMEIGDMNNQIILLFKTLIPRMGKNYSQFFDRSYFGKRDMYKSSSESLHDALKYYEKSLFCYNAINDSINVTRIHLLIARAQIEYLFAPITFLDCKRTMKFFNNELPDQEFAIDLQAIDSDHATPALEVSVSTTSIMFALDSYITFAELRYLQGRKISSQEFWTECLHTMFTLFMKETHVVVRKGAPPGFLESILEIVKRLVRLMFCYHKQFVNDNLAVIDSLLVLERELLQVLKRHNDHDAWASTPFDFDGPISGTSSTSSTTSNVSSNVSTDQETISHLIKQNKVYQALPCNHSMTKAKSIPFLRRRKKKGSLRKLSISSLRAKASLSRSTSSSTGNSVPLSEDVLSMSERVNERIWGCFFRMKQHQRKFSAQNISQQELSRRNQESMRRLWHLMKALREKVDPNDKEESNDEEENEENMSHIDQKIRHLSVSSADHLLVNCLYKTIGSQKRFHKAKGYGVSRHPSLPTDISFIKLANSVMDESTLRRLVYILRIDDIMVYYLPSTGERWFQKFGGRDLEGEKDVSWIDPDVNDYIHSVIAQGRRKKMKTGAEDDGALGTMRKLFHSAPFSYHPDPEHSKEDPELAKLSRKYRSGSKVPKFKKKMIPTILQSRTDPLYLIVSHHLQVIPWESMFSHYSTRHFTLQSLIDRKKQNISLTDMLGVDNANPTRSDIRVSKKPCFFMLYSEDEARYISPLEKDRKSWIYDDLVYELNLTPDSEKPSIVHDILPNLPLHTPVIKYGKRPKSKSYRNCYKPINFIQLSRIAQNTHNIFTHIESHLNQNQYPVFIFTFGDLVDLSECIHYLVSFRRDCTLLFIPEKYMIHAVKTLCMMQKSFAANPDAEASGAILNQTIQWLRKMLHIPVICVNPQD